MSVVIDNTEELLTVLNRLNVKVNSVDELRQLLTSINANYNPVAARLKTGKLIGIAVPCAMAAGAALTSMFVTLSAERGFDSTHVAAFGLTWGACAMASVAALIASAITMRGGSDRVASESAPIRQGATGITKQLEIGDFH